jgi:hypothetical protein
MATRKPNKRLTPLKALSPGYRRRIKAYAKARGITVREARAIPGAARGHKPAEHVARKQRETERVSLVAALTSPQKSAIRAFAREQAGKVPPDKLTGVQLAPDAFVEPMLSMATAAGYERFAAVRAFQRAARRQYQAELLDGSYESRGLGFLKDVAAQLGVPDYRWMFYHT